MTATLMRRLAHLEAAAAAQGEFRHLTTAQLQDLIVAVERQIAADDADVADDRT
jgi:hypothetical protein